MVESLELPRGFSVSLERAVVEARRFENLEPVSDQGWDRRIEGVEIVANVGERYLAPDLSHDLEHGMRPWYYPTVEHEVPEGYVAIAYIFKTYIDG